MSNMGLQGTNIKAHFIQRHGSNTKSVPLLLLGHEYCLFLSSQVLGTVQIVRYAPIFWRKLLLLSSGNKNEIGGKNNST
jgi:hypothetical protein